MTAPDHATKPLEKILRERGHPYMNHGVGVRSNAKFFNWIGSKGTLPSSLLGPFVDHRPSTPEVANTLFSLLHQRPGYDPPVRRE
jgi:hypothetical protein